MMIIICAILGGIVLPVVLAVRFTCEMRANNERIRRGEVPKKYHDLTDQPVPVDMIVWESFDRLFCCCTAVNQSEDVMYIEKGYLRRLSGR